MVKKLLGLLALLTVVYSAHAEVYVQAYQVLVNEIDEVTMGKYSYHEITLTQGEQLAVDFQVVGGLDNSLTVWLLDLANFQRYKAGQRYEFFVDSSGTIKSSFSYRFRAPEANIYYLVLDNTRKFARRSVYTYAYKNVAGETAESKKAKGFYTGIYDLLDRLFIFDAFDVYIEKCGEENAFSSPDILICQELNNVLFARNDPGAAMFVFMHEAAHSLMNVWHLPLYDNEDAADELATVLLLLVDQKIAALDAAKWWANRESNDDEALSMIWVDDRHTISPQRARNIINWINNEDQLTQRWLNLLLPKMTDGTLRGVANENLFGADTRIARQELDKRQALRRD